MKNGKAQHQRRLSDAIEHRATVSLAYRYGGATATQVLDAMHDEHLARLRAGRGTTIGPEETRKSTGWLRTGWESWADDSIAGPMSDRDRVMRTHSVP